MKSNISRTGKKMKIAIDGPAGAGKSTIAKMVASQLGFVYIDTGAMYRALTWKILQAGIGTNEIETVYKISQATDIRFEQCGEKQRVFCDGEDVTEVIRTPAVGAEVSIVAAIPRVRKVMVRKQKELARVGNVVMDGRDIGEQVLPDADFKFFITASFEERSRRRILELRAKGLHIDEEAVKAEIAKRDQMDRQREVGALKILPDSIVIDSSNLSLEALLTKILSIIREKK
jgi:cytidylate kinase